MDILYLWRPETESVYNELIKVKLNDFDCSLCIFVCMCACIVYIYESCVCLCRRKRSTLLSIFSLRQDISLDLVLTDFSDWQWELTEFYLYSTSAFITEVGCHTYFLMWVQIQIILLVKQIHFWLSHLHCPANLLLRHDWPILFLPVSKCNNQCLNVLWVRDRPYGSCLVIDWKPVWDTFLSWELTKET